MGQLSLYVTYRSGPNRMMLKSDVILLTFIIYKILIDEVCLVVANNYLLLRPETKNSV